MDALFLLFIAAMAFLCGVASASTYWIDRYEVRLKRQEEDIVSAIFSSPGAPEFDGTAGNWQMKRHERVRRHDSFHGLA